MTDLEYLYETEKYKGLSEEVRDLIEIMSQKWEIFLSDNMLNNAESWGQTDYLLLVAPKLMIWYKPHINSFKTNQSIGANRQIYLSGAFDYLSGMR